MLVAKGGVSREIDDRKLQAYREKGYTPAQKPEPEDKPPDAESKPGKKA